ncbi:MAG: hypothetical protein P8H96_13410 [Akkermansiaceae bacterium]|nr:hypothetical protein [Akkermansiaceae bacterium]
MAEKISLFVSLPAPTDRADWQLPSLTHLPSTPHSVPIPATLTPSAKLTNLANSGEQLVLSAADGSVIADFTYNDKDPWPEFADGEGCTLTLIQAQANPVLSLALNWRCSAARHGSPGTDDSLVFAGEPDDLPSFVLGVTQPEATLPNVFEFNVRLGADDFIVIPQRSDDLVSWEEVPMPTQASVFNDDGTATYRIPIDNLDSRTFLRLVITSR